MVLLKRAQGLRTAISTRNGRLALATAAITAILQRND
jgi:hypothetical protein